MDQYTPPRGFTPAHAGEIGTQNFGARSAMASYPQIALVSVSNQEAWAVTRTAPPGGNETGVFIPRSTFRAAILIPPGHRLYIRRAGNSNVTGSVEIKHLDSGESYRRND